MTTRTQCAAILAALKNGETLTPLTALNRFQCMRLSGRIWDLRHGVHDGTRYEIEDATMKDANGKRYARYWMNKKTRLEIAPITVQHYDGNIDRDTLKVIEAPVMPPAYDPKPEPQKVAPKQERLL